MILKDYVLLRFRTSQRGYDATSARPISEGKAENQCYVEMNVVLETGLLDRWC